MEQCNIPNNIQERWNGIVNLSHETTIILSSKKKGKERRNNTSKILKLPYKQTQKSDPKGTILGFVEYVRNILIHWLIHQKMVISDFLIVAQHN